MCTTWYNSKTLHNAFFKLVSLSAFPQEELARLTEERDGLITQHALEQVASTDPFSITENDEDDEDEVSMVFHGCI